MKFSVPFNWDPELIDEIIQFKNKTSEVYGTLDKIITGHGRPAWLVDPIEKSDAKEMIKSIHSEGIEFNYLLNAPCIGGKGYDKDSRINFPHT